jgi:hypothetical protein
MAYEETWTSDLQEILADHCASLVDEDGNPFRTNELEMRLDDLFRDVWQDAEERGQASVEIPDAQPLIDMVDQVVATFTVFGHCGQCDSDFGFHASCCPVWNLREAIDTFEWSI